MNATLTIWVLMIGVYTSHGRYEPVITEEFYTQADCQAAVKVLDAHGETGATCVKRLIKPDPPMPSCPVIQHKKSKPI